MVSAYTVLYVPCKRRSFVYGLIICGVCPEGCKNVTVIINSTGRSSLLNHLSTWSLLPDEERSHAGNAGWMIHITLTKQHVSSTFCTQSRLNPWRPGARVFCNCRFFKAAASPNPQEWLDPLVVFRMCSTLASGRTAQRSGPPPRLAPAWTDW